MSLPLHIFITGASSGIGAAVAEAYAAPGVTLTLHGRSTERLAEVAGKAQRRGATTHVVIGDVADQQAMAQAITEADDRQSLDIVFANAGVSRGSADTGATLKQTRALFATNWDGTLNTIHPAITLMIKRGHGQIVITSSMASFRGLAGSAAYCASKAVGRIYGEALRAELAPLGIKINVICPGFVKTPMTDVNPFTMPFLMSAERAAQIIKNGLEKNRARIAFPWPMVAMVALLAAVPQDWVNTMMKGRMRKPAFDADG